jgi:AcrR family transcriptional regulator
MKVAPARDSSPKRRLPAAERRALIVDAALKEFSELGYEQASLGTIAENAGITRTVLYGHFRSKRALYVALLEETHAHYLGRLREALIDGQSTLERLQASVDVVLDYVQERPEAWRLLHPSHAPTEPDVAADQQRIQSSARRLLAQMLAPDAERARLDPRGAVARAYFALQQAALDGLVHWWLAHPKVKRADVHEAAIKALWLGIQGIEQGESVA